MAEIAPREFEQFDQATRRINATAALLLPSSKATGENAATIGFALRDDFELNVKEFTDDLATLAILESLLLQERCTTCLVNSNAEASTLKRVAERCGVALTFVPPSCFASQIDLEDLRRLLEVEEKQKSLVTINELQGDSPAGRCLAYILKKLNLLGLSENHGQFAIEVLRLEGILRLDRSSFSALHILPAAGETSRSPTHLYGYLNRCRTKLGCSTLLQWVTQPCANLEQIRARHDIVELFLNQATLRSHLQDKNLRRLPPLQTIRQKFQAAAQSAESPGISAAALLQRCTLTQVHQMFIAYKELIAISVALDKIAAAADGAADGAVLTPSLDSLIRFPLQKSLKKLQKFGDLCEYAIDKEAILQGRVEISQTLAPDLRGLLEKRDSLLQRVEELRENAEDELGLKRGSIRMVDGGAVNSTNSTTNSNAFVFRVTKKDQRVVQDSRLFKQVKVNKADYQFTSVELQKVGQNLQIISADLEAGQEKLAAKVICAASTYWPVIRQVATLIGILDVLAGFAEVANSSSLETLTRPMMVEGPQSRLRIVGGRHPLVEQQMTLNMRGNKSESFVPNDVELGGDKGAPSFYIITGANMGGKSTFIRQVALLILMAHVGSFVPCKSAEFTVFDAVLCRIGASDDPNRGASTFMMEMAETAAILAAARPRSFVVIDELGRGTSTHEGFGLAWEVTAYMIKEIKCLGLFATHLHELAALPREVPGAANYHVECLCEEDGNIRFPYKLKENCATASHGLVVAKLAGLPASIINRASNLLEELDRRTRTIASSGGEEERIM